MNHPRPRVTPSELGEWSFCAHAWARVHLHGVQRDPSAEARLHTGDRHHRRHDRHVRTASGLLRFARWLLLLAAAIAAWLLLAGATPVALQPAAQPRGITALGILGVALLAALIVRALARGIARRTGLPAIAGYGGVSELTLTDPQRGLRGRIDRRVPVTEHGRTRFAAVEVKPTRQTPRNSRPYEGDRLQAGAGGLLLRATDPVHAADHALLVYADHTHSIPLDTPLTDAIDHTIHAIRAAHNQGSADRNHTQPARCRGCSVRTGCAQRLA